MNNPLNKQACNPHGYWLTGHLFLFILNTHKTQINDVEWRVIV